jgi:hypothetical protein
LEDYWANQFEPCPLYAVSTTHHRRDSYAGIAADASGAGGTCKNRSILESKFSTNLTFHVASATFSGSYKKNSPQLPKFVRFPEDNSTDGVLSFIMMKEKLLNVSRDSEFFKFLNASQRDQVVEDLGRVDFDTASAYVLFVQPDRHGVYFSPAFNCIWVMFGADGVPVGAVFAGAGADGVAKQYYLTTALNREIVSANGFKYTPISDENNGLNFNVGEYDEPKDARSRDCPLGSWQMKVTNYYKEHPYMAGGKPYSTINVQFQRLSPNTRPGNLMNGATNYATPSDPFDQVQDVSRLADMNPNQVKDKFVTDLCTAYKPSPLGHDCHAVYGMICTLQCSRGCEPLSTVRCSNSSFSALAKKANGGAFWDIVPSCVPQDASVNSGELNVA